MKIPSFHRSERALAIGRQHNSEFDGMEMSLRERDVK